MKYLTIAGATVLLLLSGCKSHTAPPPPVKPVAKEIKQAPPTPIDIKRVELGGHYVGSGVGPHRRRSPSSSASIERCRA